MVKRLSSHPMASGNLNGLKTLEFGGAPMYLSDTKIALQIFGNTLYQLYGQGEAPMTITNITKAMYSDEMNKISSVYHNRLKKDMLLQADPTIQYILPKKKKRILVKDTKIKNPYNTYINKGLPPGPINNPGIDALVAAGDPLETDYLYFVADKKGRHIFNKTFKAHLRSKK